MSVWLPVDFGFAYSIDGKSQGERIFLDLDKGFYLWQTRDGYEPIELHVSRIKLVDYEKKTGRL